jgi:hypothetical protein
LSPSKIGHVTGRERDPEVALDVVEELERVLAGAVALVDEREDRRAPLVAHLEQLPRALLDAAAVVEQHHRRVGGDERAVGVLAEVGVARACRAG